ncbi:MAG: hypothetical protein HYY95_02950 [Candidatus Rokubacteria bacterium]|nr:hypothetical protein [Candidatus Rokubacteria bacterium]MBI3104534.1 hypothetical protein [Candidatus Rokubacteria bacterium]
MRRPRLLACLLLLMALGGCAMSPRSTETPHTRCLSERDPGPSRPLVFLFCIESP